MDNPKNRNPISGLTNVKPLALRDCIAYARKGDPPRVAPCPDLDLIDMLPGRLDQAMDAGGDAQDMPNNTLTVNEAAAIHFYTQESVFYRVLNDCLRSENREKLRCFLPYLRLLLDALYKLALVPQRTVYRGVKAKLVAGYAEGRELVWWTITSTSLKSGVATTFAGHGACTIFTVETGSIVDITEYSAIKGEKECILLPGWSLCSVQDQVYFLPARTTSESAHHKPFCAQS
jgi:hypothetical protein